MKHRSSALLSALLTAILFLEWIVPRSSAYALRAESVGESSHLKKLKAGLEEDQSPEEVRLRFEYFARASPQTKVTMQFKGFPEGMLNTFGIPAVFGPHTPRIIRDRLDPFLESLRPGTRLRVFIVGFGSCQLELKFMPIQRVYPGNRSPGVLRAGFLLLTRAFWEDAGTFEEAFQAGFSPGKPRYIRDRPAPPVEITERQVRELLGVDPHDPEPDSASMSLLSLTPDILEGILLALQAQDAGKDARQSQPEPLSAKQVMRTLYEHERLGEIIEANSARVPHQAVAGFVERVLVLTGLDQPAGGSAGSSTGLEETVQPARVFSAHGNKVQALAFSPGGAELISAGADQRMIAHSLESGSSRPVTERPGLVRSAAVSADGELLATGIEKGTVRVLRFSDGSEVWHRFAGREGHSDDVLVIGFSSGGQSVATIGKDRRLRIWSAADGAMQQEFLLSERPVTHADLSLARGLAVAVDDLGQAQAWIFAESECQRYGGLSVKGGVTSAALHPTQEIVAVALPAGEIALYEAGSEDKKIRDLRGHKEPAQSMTFSPSGRLLASGHGGGQILLWDVGTGEAVATLEGQPGSVSCLIFSPDGNRVASGSSQGPVTVWEVPEGIRTRLAAGPAASAVSPAAPGPAEAAAPDRLEAAPQEVDDYLLQNERARVRWAEGGEWRFEESRLRGPLQANPGAGGAAIERIIQLARQHPGEIRVLALRLLRRGAQFDPAGGTINFSLELLQQADLGLIAAAMEQAGRLEAGAFGELLAWADAHLVEAPAPTPAPASAEAKPARPEKPKKTKASKPPAPQVSGPAPQAPAPVAQAPGPAPAPAQPESAGAPATRAPKISITLPAPKAPSAATPGAVRRTLAKDTSTVLNGEPLPNQLVVRYVDLAYSDVTVEFDVSGSPPGQRINLAVLRRWTGSKWPLLASVPEPPEGRPTAARFSTDGAVQAAFDQNPHLRALEALGQRPPETGESQEAEHLTWLREMAAGIRQVLRHRSGEPGQAQAEWEALRGRYPERADALSQAVEAVRRHLQAEFELKRAQVQVIEQLGLQADAEGDPESVRNEVVAEELGRFMASFESWRQEQMSVRGFQEEAAGQPEGRQPVDGVLSYLDELSHRVRYQRRILLPQWAQPMALAQVYRRAVHLALWDFLGQVEEGLRLEDPSTLLLTNLAIWLREELLSLELADAFERGVLRATEEPKARDAVRFPIGGVGILLVQRGPEGGAPWQIRQHVRGGGGACFPIYRAATYAPYRLADWHQESDAAVALLYPSFSGFPNVEQVSFFLEDRFAIRNALRGAPEVWLGVADADGNVRLFRPDPGVAEEVLLSQYQGPAAQRAVDCSRKCANLVREEGLAKPIMEFRREEKEVVAGLSSARDLNTRNRWRSRARDLRRRSDARIHRLPAVLEQGLRALGKTEEESGRIVAAARKILQPDFKKLAGISVGDVKQAATLVSELTRITERALIVIEEELGRELLEEGVQSGFLEPVVIPGLTVELQPAVEAPSAAEVNRALVEQAEKAQKWDRGELEKFAAQWTGGPRRSDFNKGFRAWKRRQEEAAREAGQAAAAAARAEGEAARQARREAVGRAEARIEALRAVDLTDPAAAEQELAESAAALADVEGTPVSARLQQARQGLARAFTRQAAEDTEQAFTELLSGGAAQAEQAGLEEAVERLQRRLDAAVKMLEEFPALAELRPTLELARLRLRIARVVRRMEAERGGLTFRDAGRAQEVVAEAQELRGLLDPIEDQSQRASADALLTEAGKELLMQASQALFARLDEVGPRDKEVDLPGMVELLPHFREGLEALRPYLSREDERWFRRELLALENRTEDEARRSARRQMKRGGRTAFREQEQALELHRGQRILCAHRSSGRVVELSFDGQVEEPAERIQVATVSLGTPTGLIPLGGDELRYFEDKRGGWRRFGGLKRRLQEHGIESAAPGQVFRRDFKTRVGRGKYRIENLVWIFGASDVEWILDPQNDVKVMRDPGENDVAFQELSSDLRFELTRVSEMKDAITLRVTDPLGLYGPPEVAEAGAGLEEPGTVQYLRNQLEGWVGVPWEKLVSAEVLEGVPFDERALDPAEVQGRLTASGLGSALRRAGQGSEVVASRLAEAAQRLREEPGAFRVSEISFPSRFPFSVSDEAQTAWGMVYRPAQAEGPVPVALIPCYGFADRFPQLLALYLLHHNVGSVLVAMPLHHPRAPQGWDEEKLKGPERWIRALSAREGSGTPEVWRARFIEQCLADLLVTAEWVRTQPWADGRRVSVAGHSLGATLAHQLFHLDPRTHAAMSSNPIVDIGAVFWDAERYGPVREYLASKGRSRQQSVDAHAHLDPRPIASSSPSRADRMLMFVVREDELVPDPESQALWEKEGRPQRTDAPPPESGSSHLTAWQLHLDNIFPNFLDLATRPAQAGMEETDAVEAYRSEVEPVRVAMEGLGVEGTSPGEAWFLAQIADRRGYVMLKPMDQQLDGWLPEAEGVSREQLRVRYPMAIASELVREIEQIDPRTRATSRRERPPYDGEVAFVVGRVVLEAEEFRHLREGEMPPSLKVHLPEHTTLEGIRFLAQGEDPAVPRWLPARRGMSVREALEAGAVGYKTNVMLPVLLPGREYSPYWKELTRANQAWVGERAQECAAAAGGLGFGHVAGMILWAAPPLEFSPFPEASGEMAKPDPDPEVLSRVMEAWLESPEKPKMEAGSEFAEAHGGLAAEVVGGWAKTPGITLIMTAGPHFVGATHQWEDRKAAAQAAMEDLAQADGGRARGKLLLISRGRPMELVQRELESMARAGLLAGAAPGRSLLRSFTHLVTGKFLRPGNYLFEQRAAIAAVQVLSALDGLADGGAPGAWAGRGIAPGPAAEIVWAARQPRAGLEEVEAIGLAEFEQGGRFQLTQDQLQLADHFKHQGAGKVLLKPLPSTLFLYTQGEGLFQVAKGRLRRPAGPHLEVLQAAGVRDWQRPALVLKDKQLDRELEHPADIPEEPVWAADVPGIDPAELLMWFFRDLPAIQAAEVVGQMLVTDGERMFLAVFSA